MTKRQMREAVVFRCLAIAFVVIVTGCGVAPVGTQSSASKPVSATPRPSPTPEPELVFDGTVPVAADRELAAQCWGSGSPTVLLEAGGTR